MPGSMGGRRLKSHKLRHAKKHLHHKLRNKDDHHTEEDKIVAGKKETVEVKKAVNPDKFDCAEFCCKASYPDASISEFCDANCETVNKVC